MAKIENARGTVLHAARRAAMRMRATNGQRSQRDGSSVREMISAADATIRAHGRDA